MWRKLTIIVVLLCLAGYAAYEQFGHKEQAVKVKQEKSEAAMKEIIARNGIEIGKSAPDFTLTKLDGTNVKLSDLKGKKVILNFWATWCGPCQQEMPDMEAFYKEHKENVEILAVNYTPSEKGGGEEKVSNFAKEKGITFPILLDKNIDVTTAYKVITIPTSYFIDTKGVIQDKFIGPMTQKEMEKRVAKLK
ncbi:MAG TPA: thiol:disulfide interchange protein [Bacillus sp. (in: Bacteria)]|jgi:peroxiredoxin|uniref:Thiol:disulfide interchange protein n=4 Tax=Bacillus cereus group TaxID=86661 RepID=A0A9X5N627_BACTU|nr:MULTISPECIES: redoxin domain-containing protein [Bacillus]MCU7390904.1 redoxin domain-containing protein [Bacillus sp. ST24]NIE92895.1 redoxin domain-containing protein [Bacillus sp. Ab-1751]WIL45795.1 redoxin domain-containing protein [Bacillus bombysepticus]CGG51490.1 thioredoxin [Streptococcus pneumoniae]BCA32668.1 thiol:disulfide interchange protein tlpA [Bacillus wiedmannii]HCF52335.1 thiol:disulfide interchange protein [Bacillus sp. (in: firmicutes)]